MPDIRVIIISNSVFNPIKKLKPPHLHFTRRKARRSACNCSRTSWNWRRDNSNLRLKPKAALTLAYNLSVDTYTQATYKNVHEQAQPSAASCFAVRRKSVFVQPIFTTESNYAKAFDPP